MSKYIDADVLIRYGKQGSLVYWEDIETAPSIDIVRCKECKHKSNGHEFMWCDHEHGMDMVKPDDFCSYGERSEE